MEASRGIVVFSGGSAANALVDVFQAVRENKKCSLSYVIPISDNGGSSSELIRVFGGPGIGDVRSRLVRLIPSDDSTNPTKESDFAANASSDPSNPLHASPSNSSESQAIKVFFNHRLPKDRHAAKLEWLQIVEADHPLWHNISSAKKELIRSFLNMVNFEIVKRLRPSSTFNFSSASIGNLFLTGARLFSGSFESAIYLLSSICSVPQHTSVLPVINTNFTHHISAGLADGTVITGQNSISHPSITTALEAIALGTAVPRSNNAALPASDAPSPAPSTPSIVARDREGESLGASGSALGLGLGKGLALSSAHRTALGNEQRLRQDILQQAGNVLQSSSDHSPPSHDDEPIEVEDANLPGSLPTLRRSQISFSKTTAASPNGGHGGGDNLPSRIQRLWYINPYGQEITLSANPRVLSALQAATTVIYSIGSLYTSIVPSLILKGVGERLARGEVKHKILILNSTLDRETSGGDPFTALDFIAAIATAAHQSRLASSLSTSYNTLSAVPGLKMEIPETEYAKYVTHLIHLSSPEAPAVDKDGLSELGIECIRVYGRKNPGEDITRYDEKALIQALEVLIGERRPVEQKPGKSRRNTFEG